MWEKGYMQNLFNFLSIFCQNKFALKIDKIVVKKKKSLLKERIRWEYY